MKRPYLIGLGLLACLSACDSQQKAKDSAENRQVVDMAAHLRQTGDAPGAVNALSAAQAQHPNDPALLKQLGYAQISNGQPEEAVKTFDQLISLTPNDPLAYDGKAVAFDSAGNHLAAQELYEQALKLSPESPRIRNNLAMSLILNNQLDEAIALLEKLQRSSGGNKTIRQNLALAYGLKGDKAKALGINMEDLTPDEAQENMRFYERYAAAHKKMTSAEKIDPDRIGFAETTQKEKSEPVIAAPIIAEDPADKEDAPAPAKEAPAVENTGMLDYTYPGQK